MNYYIKKQTKNYIYVAFNGVSFINIYYFLIKQRYSRKKIWIYRDVLISENTELLEFDKVRSTHIINRKKSRLTGNDILVLSNKQYKNQIRKIFKLLYTNDDYDLADIDLVCYSHDSDWLTICVIKDHLLFKELMYYLSDFEQLNEVYNFQDLLKY